LSRLRKIVTTIVRLLGREAGTYLTIGP
jgi:hypothetical protein